MTMPVATNLFTKVHIRWMIRIDMPAVLAIEAASHDFPWGEDEFLRYLRERQVIGMVAERGERILGFMVYELAKRELAILNFAVRPEFRRQGVGHQMVEKLKGKLSAHRRTRLAVDVRETNLAGSLFLSSRGFAAIEVVREHFGDTGEDCYRFEYLLPAGEDEAGWPLD